MSLYRATAVVLRTHKLGEADRIVVLLTRERGKVRAVAKGVRRTGSKFGSRMDPGSHVRLQLYEGRGELDIVTQAETVEPHHRLREDLDRLTAATALLEIMDVATEEGEADARRFDMLAGALRTVEERNPPLVVAAFAMKLLAAEGVGPEVEACVGCGGADEGTDALVGYDAASGGMRCASCGGGRPVSPGALLVLREILGGRLNQALARPADATAHEVEDLAVAAMEAHLERRLKSVRVLGHR